MDPAGRGVTGQSLSRSRRSEDTEHPRCPSAGPGVEEGQGGASLRPGRCCLSVLSVVGSAAAVAAAGCFCALLYPILKELRTERVRGQDGTEQRMLGFWSVLVLSVMVGCVCCISSWTLTYLDCRHAGCVFTLANLRNKSGFNLGYGVAVLNGFMGVLTAIWSLS